MIAPCFPMRGAVVMSGIGPSWSRATRQPWRQRGRRSNDYEVSEATSHSLSELRAYRHRGVLTGSVLWPYLWMMTEEKRLQEEANFLAFEDMMREGLRRRAEREAVEGQDENENKVNIFTREPIVPVRKDPMVLQMEGGIIWIGCSWRSFVIWVGCMNRPMIVISSVKHGSYVSSRSSMEPLINP